jgi:hypothetical protein
MRRRQTISYLLAAGCLLTGSVIYVLFRPTTLLMFHGADSLGLTGSIGTMRSWVDGCDRYLPNWIIYSLPFALWVSSYLFFIEGIWGRSIPVVRYAWFRCVPIIAIAAELAQSIYIIPGHFDSVDLITIIFATILGFFTTDFNR